MAWLDAFTLAHQGVSPLGAEDVALAAACGRTLAADLRSLTALPAFDTAAMDGYAVAGGGPWLILDEVGARAGAGWSTALEPGEAVPIATGAPVPRGADRVLPQEVAEVDETALSAAELPAKQHIRHRGEDTALDEVVATAGSAVTPALIGLAASVGYDSLPVRCRPRIVLVVTGNELAASGVPTPPQVRDALGPMVTLLTEQWGGVLLEVVQVGDQEPLPLSQDADVVIVTGSTSVGVTDRLRGQIPPEQRVADGIACRPGHPMLLARISEGPWIVGLPGNPNAAFVAAHTLLWPLLAGLAGQSLPSLRRITMEPSSHGTHVLPVRKDGKLWVVCPGYGSASLRGAALAEGLAIVEPDGSAQLLRF